MKKLFYLLLCGTVILAGCFDTTQEITINKDGSGNLTNTTDMSQVIGMAKQFGGDQFAEMESMVKDTIMQLDQAADSIPNLSATEIATVKKGSLAVNVNMKEEKFITKLSFPFQQASDIAMLNKLSDKVISEAMKKQMESGATANPMGGEMPATSSVDDYYVTTFNKNVIEKKLNKEKYANAAGDEYLKNMQEVAGMGATMTNTLIINLPRAVKKVEGANVQVSDDKKRITIKAGIDDFFDHPEKFEFKIEY
jgi:hypothetical protein